MKKAIFSLMLISFPLNTLRAEDFSLSRFVEENWDRPKHECLATTGTFGNKSYRAWSDSSDRSAKMAVDECQANYHKPSKCRLSFCTEVRSEEWILYHLERASGLDIRTGTFSRHYYAFAESLQDAKRASLTRCRNEAGKPRRCKVYDCAVVRSNDWIWHHADDIRVMD